MVLPTGQVLVSNSTFVQVYTPANTKFPRKWAPTIKQFPATVVLGSTYQISGQQFNGMSQAASFGDELETATNYPLVRITNNATGHVFYARTHGHSTMGVATGRDKSFYELRCSGGSRDRQQFSRSGGERNCF